jgi:hypothetical protein
MKKDNSYKKICKINFMKKSKMKNIFKECIMKFKKNKRSLMLLPKNLRENQI